MRTGAWKRCVAGLKVALSAFLGRILLAAAEEEMALHRQEVMRELVKAGPDRHTSEQIHT